MPLSRQIISNQLNNLNLTLPNATTPGGNYRSIVVRKKTVFVAIQFPIRNDEYLFTGKLGSNLTTEQGYEALQLCSLNVIAQLNEKVGFEKILALNHLDIYFQSVEPWDSASAVANGASDLFIDLFGEAGHHTRALMGVEKLPLNFSVGLVSSFTLR